MNNEFLKTKREISNWLLNRGISNTLLVEDPIYGFVVNVSGDVRLDKKELSYIPVKFNYVNGMFRCDSNKLTSLEFAPESVRFDFFCDSNELTSLEFCPQYVRGSFWCTDNQLTSLAFCPTEVKGGFYCYKNPALQGSQQINKFSEILKISEIEKEKMRLENQLPVSPTAFNNSKAPLFKV